MQTAIVTGASSGIGRAAARKLAGAGFRVLAVGRQLESLEAVAADIRRDGAECMPLEVDLLEVGACERVIASAVEQFGRVDVLVNAAGILTGGTIETTSLEDGDLMMGINVRVPLLLIQLAVPELQKTRGTIVNVSSVAGLRAFPNLLVYCVSKAALDQLTRCAALDLAPKGIRVNAVNPGVVVSNLHRRSGMSEEDYEAFLERAKTTHPLGRPGEPDEIAELILFLASERSGWITGETIAIDGGRHLTCNR